MDKKGQSGQQWLMHRIATRDASNLAEQQTVNKLCLTGTLGQYETFLYFKRAWWCASNLSERGAIR